MKPKKLSLNKEKIVKLTRDQSASINGGKASASSSWNDFTCCWCSNGGDGPSKTNNCVTKDMG
ncbi:hypothetical protein SAMN05421796_101768 [Chryseobacterium piscicola]|uniref:Uncharacterized protein n=1 Tax=Chryseobacterium piscicola TaxID=551459 RepID=A0A1N7KRA1_9FLAO|nr:class I lanthipeptide [Chryseobacterium piscicola]PQA94971.1 hypothetical protein B0A70_06525 [Chryseobacterium piscicola]SIS64152.1 hypothetical protein SAMN05421796_101768 [Chryseobacterium piscicola]